MYWIDTANLKTYCDDPDGLYKLFHKRIIEKDAFNKYCSTAVTRVIADNEKMEEKFKTFNYYHRKIRKMENKYYLANRSTNEKDENNIHMALKEKVAHLNQANGMNRYFLKVESNILKKAGNKHTYVIYEPEIIEFKSLNLFTDIIAKTAFNENRIEGEYLSIECGGDVFKNVVYKAIMKILSNQKELREYDEHCEFYSHNQIISAVQREIRSIFKKRFSLSNAPVKELYEEIVSIEPYYKNVYTIRLGELLTYMMKRGDDRSIKRVYSLFDKLIKLGLYPQDITIIS